MSVCWACLYKWSQENGDWYFQGSIDHQLLSGEGICMLLLQILSHFFFLNEDILLFPP